MKKNLGEFYDETSDFQQAQFDNVTKLIHEHLPVEKIETLLDIGSGTGKRTKDCFDIFPNLKHITALEPDPDMYEQGIKHHNDPRIQYLKKSASHIRHMEIGKGFFDVILSHWTVHWIKEKEELFRDIERVTDDHKKSYLIFSTCAALPQILQDVDTYIRTELGISPLGESPFYYYNRRQWEKLLEQNGWKIKTFQDYSITHEVPDSKEYLEHWFATSTAKFTYNRHLAEINSLAQADLLYFMEQKYGVDGKEKTLRFTEDVLFVIAEK